MRAIRTIAVSDGGGTACLRRALITINQRNACRRADIKGSRSKLERDTSLCSLHEVQKLCEKGRIIEALQVVELMQKCGDNVSTDSLMSILQGCIKKKDLESGRKASVLITRCGLESNNFLGTHLIHMFTSCGSLLEAQEIFHKLPEQTEFSWAAIISAHAKLGKEMEALNLYKQMKSTGVRADGYIFVAVLKACSHISALEQGKLIHVHVVEDGYCSNVFVGNLLISMYAKCGNLEDACRIFERVPRRDIVSWSALIAGYAKHGPGEDAVRLFKLMQQEGMKPDKVILVSVLNACSSIKALDQGRMIHNLLTDYDIASDAFLQCALVDMYAHCGSVSQARELFDKLCSPCLVVWNAMISGYAQHRHGHEALQLFKEMKQKGVEPDSVTYLSIVKAGSSIGALEKAKFIHAHIMESDHDTNALIENALIDMYTKCGCLEGAHKVFVKMKQKTVVTWNAMIAAYTQLGHGREALQHYQYMQQGNTDPDTVTFVCALKACSSKVALDQGKLIHANIMERNHETNMLVGNTLIDMYAKCGDLEDACLVFDNMPQRDVVTWTAIIEGLAKHNRYNKVIQYFVDMQRQGVKPNSVTFLSLLSVCRCMGLVDEGRNHFKLMKEEYNIAPTLEHYSCMVDLLAHTGHFDEAEELLHLMPSEFNGAGWMSLLGRYNHLQSNRIYAKKKSSTEMMV